MIEEVEVVLLGYLSQVQQMKEKEPKLLEILKKNNMDSYYVMKCADLIVRLNKFQRAVTNLSDMYYIVGGIKK